MSSSTKDTPLPASTAAATAAATQPVSANLGDQGGVVVEMERLPPPPIQNTPPRSPLQSVGKANHHDLSNSTPSGILQDSDDTPTLVHGNGLENAVTPPENVDQISPPPLDIEHLVVENDPRLWSRTRKNAVLGIIAFTAMGGTISASIYFPAIDDLQHELNTSDTLVALSVSLFILGQGVFPMIWSGISEIKGRKVSYIASLLIYCVATTVCSRANSMGVFVTMRVFQSMGSSAVLALGAGTLADVFDVEERGTKLGLYYGVPLLGPSLGPLLGGAITTVGSWRSTFYFLVGYGLVCLISMIWLPETFRKERSLAWRLAMKRARADAKLELEKARATLPPSGGSLLVGPQDEGLPRQNKRTAFALQLLHHHPPAPKSSPSALEKGSQVKSPAAAAIKPTLGRALTAVSLKSSEDKLKVSFRDVNPFAAVGSVLRQRHNFLAILFSGLLYASQYSVTYTTSRVFAAAPYNYGSLKVGLVLFAFGTGSVLGSFAGGRYSDHVFNKLKERNGGKGQPEMRIRSTFIALYALPPILLTFAWVVQKHVPAYWPIIMLFLLGLSMIWIYSSTLAYVVDSNPGRSSSAVACNSLFRGVLAAIASQAAEPIINGIGHGWYYTGFAFVLLSGEGVLLYVNAKGQGWRDDIATRAAEKELDKAEKRI